MLCHSLSEEQHHTTNDGYSHLHTHGQGQSCERSRCEAGRYFLGAPPSGRDAWWGPARSILPLSKNSLENQEGHNSSMPHITTIHSYHGEDQDLGHVHGSDRVIWADEALIILDWARHLLNIQRWLRVFAVRLRVWVVAKNINYCRYFLSIDCFHCPLLQAGATGMRTA